MSTAQNTYVAAVNAAAATQTNARAAAVAALQAAVSLAKMQQGWVPGVATTVLTTGVLTYVQQVYQ